MAPEQKANKHFLSLNHFLLRCSSEGRFLPLLHSSSQLCFHQTLWVCFLPVAWKFNELFFGLFLTWSCWIELNLLSEQNKNKDHLSAPHNKLNYDHQTDLGCVMNVKTDVNKRVQKDTRLHAIVTFKMKNKTSKIWKPGRAVTKPGGFCLTYKWCPCKNNN